MFRCTILGFLLLGACQSSKPPPQIRTNHVRPVRHRLAEAPPLPTPAPARPLMCPTSEAIEMGAKQLPSCPTKLGATVPVTCSFLTQGSVFIDPVSGNDSNTCITSGSACQTYSEVTRRWGCGGSPTSSPLLAQATTIKWLTSEATAVADEVVFAPRLTNGAKAFIVGALSAGTPGTISAINEAKNASANQPLVITTSIPSPVAGLMIHNTTHASRAWIDVVSDHVTMTQPLVSSNATIPLGLFPAEVDSWNTSDTVAFETPAKVNLRYYAPVYQDGTVALSGNSLAYLSNIWIQDPSGSSSYSEIFIGNNVIVQEVRSDAAVNMMSTGDGLDLATGTLGEIDNNWIAGLSVNAEQVNGGAIGTLNPGFAINVFGFRNVFDADITLHGYLSTDGGELGAFLAYFAESAPTSGVSVFAGHLTSSTGGPYGAPALYGKGIIDVLFNATASYPAGAGAAVATYPLTGGIEMDNITVGCLGNPASTGTTLTCNLALTPASLDSHLGTTVPTGCLYVPGGASFCNFNE